MFGGYTCDNVFSGEFFEYDIETAECKLLTHNENEIYSPSPRYYHTSAIVNDVYYLMGGWRSSCGRSNLEHIYRYDLIHCCWMHPIIAPKTAYSTLGISESCSVSVGDTIVTFGGRTESTSSSTNADYFLINPETMDYAITKDIRGVDADDVENGRAGHCMLTLSNGRIAVIGGSKDEDEDLQIDHDLLIIHTNLFDNISVVQQFSPYLFTQLPKNTKFDAIIKTD
jgi:hypothetical protein